jgi:hypothetical protein
MLDSIISGTFNRDDGGQVVRVYRDTSERLGVPWPEELRERCSAADIVLVVIGPQWLEAKDGLRAEGSIGRTIGFARR